MKSGKERKKGKEKYDFDKFNKEHPILECYLHQLCVLLGNRYRYDKAKPIEKTQENEESDLILD